MQNYVHHRHSLTSDTMHSRQVCVCVLHTGVSRTRSMVRLMSATAAVYMLARS